MVLGAGSLACRALLSLSFSSARNAGLCFSCSFSASLCVWEGEGRRDSGMDYAMGGSHWLAAMA